MSTATSQTKPSPDCGSAKRQAMLVAAAERADAYASVSTPAAAALAYFSRRFARCACACAERAASSGAGSALKAVLARVGRALALSGANCCA